MRVRGRPSLQWPQVIFALLILLLLTYAFLTFYNWGEQAKTNSEGIEDDAFDSGEELDFSGFKPNVQTFLKGTEEIRKRFLGKREKFLMQKRRPGEISLWEAWDGATIVWNYFAPTFTCPHFVERIGTPGDGGKWICGLNVFVDKSKKDCIVYSFGVAEESTFEMEILERTSCKIYAYDPTVNQMNLKNLSPSVDKNRIHFFKIGLGDVDDPSRNLLTLGYLMKKNGHDWIDFLKVDIEGAEFTAFKQISNQFKTFPFGHLNIEIHLRSNFGWLDWLAGGKKGERDEFARMFALYAQLEGGGLRAFTWEDNHNPCIRGLKPTLMEYSFVNVKNNMNAILDF